MALDNIRARVSNATPINFDLAVSEYREAVANGKGKCSQVSLWLGPHFDMHNLAEEEGAHNIQIGIATLEGDPFIQLQFSWREWEVLREAVTQCFTDQEIIYDELHRAVINGELTQEATSEDDEKPQNLLDTPTPGG